MKTLKFILSTVCILAVAFGTGPDNYLSMIGWYIFWFQLFLLTVNRYVKNLSNRLVYLLMETGCVIPSIFFIIGFVATDYTLPIFALLLLSIFSIYDTIRNWNKMDEVLKW